MEANYFLDKEIPNKTSYRIVHLALGSSVETRKVDCNIKIGGNT